jgi:hypothetical protein
MCFLNPSIPHIDSNLNTSIWLNPGILTHTHFWDLFCTQKQMNHNYEKCEMKVTTCVKICCLLVHFESFYQRCWSRCITESYSFQFVNYQTIKMRCISLILSFLFVCLFVWLFSEWCSNICLPMSLKVTSWENFAERVKTHNTSINIHREKTSPVFNV